MILRIDPTSAKPPYEQVRQQVIEQIESGQLSEGAKLPAVRRLAADLDLAPNTVARTYRELEAAGYVRTMGRNGTVVAPRGFTGNDDVHSQAARLSAEFVQHMRALGLQRDDVVAYVHRVWG